jgi:integrase
MPRKLKGIRRKGKGWEAYVRVRGKLHTQRFPIDHPVDKMRAWLTLQKKLFGGRSTSSGTLAADVERFLAKPDIAAQPYAHQTAHRLGLWVAALGADRDRWSIERDEIEAVIQGWLKQYAEPTVYHRRSALMQLYRVLDGAGAANPVKNTTCPRSWIPADHSVAFETLAAIVTAMPEWSYPKKGHRERSIAKLVGRVIVEVGIRPADLLKVRKTDIDAAASTLRWPASAKGKGTTARIVPLTPGGLSALLALEAAGGLGAFNPTAVSHSFKRSARAIAGDETPIHLYSGRHAVGADLYRATRDLATVGRMLNHAPGSRATAQYAQGANADVDRAAATALSAARRVPPAARKLAAKLAAPHKRRLMNRLQRRS